VRLWAHSSGRNIYLKRWFGDLGNNMIQMAHAEYLSQQKKSAVHSLKHQFLRIEQQYLLHTMTPSKTLDSGDLTSTMLLADLQNISNHVDKSSTFLYRTFFYKYDIFPFMPNLTDYRHILKNKILPLIPYKNDNSITDETLVIHIRSGDIFRDHWVHNAYVQPPLNFYLKIIEEFGFRDIVIVTQDDLKNPCIQQLKQLIPGIRIQASSLTEDVSTILSARNLITAMSTFSLALGFSSEKIEKLFIPQFDIKRSYWRILFWSTIMQIFSNNFDRGIEDIDFEIYRTKILNYIPIGNWENTQVQRNLMLSHSRKYLVLTR
jgi:hypothetical protein